MAVAKRENDVNIESKKYNITNSLVMWIILLSFTDALFTDVGLRLNFIAEWNPFARFLYELNVGIFYLYKLLLPIVLYILYQYVYGNRLIDIAIYACFGLYAVINLYHLYWLGIVVFV
ncbi:DUF5658 family protein [Evansella cellulosilytica]|uniref:DUF5658 domain-containing protein n=1 Tax=Evansella cellulosilytica (strain ATCC 21833 / DSM 2522 / FERM P-1141 / JCM 9156 / N-4) TaxID=649639 RepID=E6TT11_EVAC2|nr:DUF5658 family protein [Evansella cellulosilytica]ADU31919.1 hypothetical protein Bcell_3678 [Evansella cellulosilytica DSM 2522]